MIEETENKPFESSWNLTMSLILDIGNYLRNAGNNFLLGNLDRYFWNLNLITKRIHPFLSKEEKEELKALELEISQTLSLIKNIDTLSDKNKEILMQRKMKLPEQLSTYDNTIMDCLNKYKFLIPAKTDNTRLM